MIDVVGAAVDVQGKKLNEVVEVGYGKTRRVAAAAVAGQEKGPM